MNYKLITAAAAVFIAAVCAAPFGGAQSQAEAMQQQTPSCVQEGRFNFMTLPVDRDGLRRLPLYNEEGDFAALLTIMNESTNPLASFNIVGLEGSLLFRTVYPGNSISLLAVSDVELNSRSAEVVGRYMITAVGGRQQ